MNSIHNPDSIKTDYTFGVEKHYAIKAQSC